MSKYNRLLYHSTFVLVILSTGFLVFNMLETLTYEQQIFFEQEIISGVEIVILIGLGLVLLFDVASLLWGWVRLRQSERANIGDIATLGQGKVHPHGK